MIKEVSGDILLSSAKSIAHGVAPDDHLASGLALALRERWPSLAKDFRHWHRESSPKAGALWTWSAPDGTRVFNLLTQEPAQGGHGHPGPARLEHVNHALRALRKEIERERPASVALPRLATGVGGLAWSDVKPLIDKHLGDLDIPVFVYTRYQPDLKADEVA